MVRIMADNDVLGHVRHLAYICQSRDWIEFWRGLSCVVYSFDDFGLQADASDSDVWQICQDNDVILITGNRTAKGPDSLETTIREHNDASCLPVLTISDADRIAHDREYAMAVVERLFEILLDIDLVRGTGRLFLP